MAGLTTSSLSTYTAKSTKIFKDQVLYTTDMKRYEIQDGVFYKEKLNFIDANPYAQSSLCGSTPSGDTVLTQKDIEVAPIVYKDRFCKTTLSTFSFPQKQGLANGEFAPEFLDALTEAEVDKIKQKHDQELWLGTQGFADGWFANVSGCSGAISLTTYSATTVTVSNIDNIVDDFLANITDTMWNTGELTLHCSLSIYTMYQRNRLSASNFRDQNVAFGPFEMWLDGFEGRVKIKAEPGLNGSNYMMLTWDKNLVIGTDDIREIAQLEWLYDPIEKYLWAICAYRIGTQIKFCDQVIHNMY